MEVIVSIVYIPAFGEGDSKETINTGDTIERILGSKLLRINYPIDFFKEINVYIENDLTDRKMAALEYNHVELELYLMAAAQPSYNIRKIIDFIKDSMDHNRRFRTFYEFLKSHRCVLANDSNSTCFGLGYSYLKCGNCKNAHYCTKRCQLRDWEEHSTLCQQLKTRRKLKMRSIRTMRENLELEFQKKMMSYKGVVKRAMFEIFKIHVANLGSVLGALIASRSPATSFNN